MRKFCNQIVTYSLVYVKSFYVKNVIFLMGITPFLRLILLKRHGKLKKMDFGSKGALS